MKKRVLSKIVILSLLVMMFSSIASHGTVYTYNYNDDNYYTYSGDENNVAATAKMQGNDNADTYTVSTHGVHAYAFVYMRDSNGNADADIDEQPSGSGNGTAHAEISGPYVGAPVYARHTSKSDTYSTVHVFTININ